MSTGIRREGNVVGEKWRLDRRLGDSTVYDATNVRNGYPVAVKVLDSGALDESTLQAALRQASIGNSVYRGAVRVFDSGILADGCAYLVMERLRGETLEARCRREGGLRVETAVSLACEVLTILAEAHARGIAHRNVTLANVFVTSEGNLRLLGFGGHFARRMAPSSHTLCSNVAVLEEAVTRPYVSGPAVDMRAVGLLLVELCKPAFVPPAIARVIDRAQAAEFLDAEKMIHALEVAVSIVSTSDSEELSPTTLRLLPTPPSTPRVDPADAHSSRPSWPHNSTTIPSPSVLIATSHRGMRANAPTIRTKRRDALIARNCLIPAAIGFIVSLLVMTSVGFAPESLREATRSVVMR